MTSLLSPEKRAAIEQRLLSQIDQIKDGRVKTHYHQTIGRRLSDYFWRDDRGKLTEAQIPPDHEIDAYSQKRQIEDDLESLETGQCPSDDEMHSADLAAYYWAVEAPYHAALGKWPLRLMDLSPAQLQKWRQGWLTIGIDDIGKWFGAAPAEKLPQPSLSPRR